MSQEKKNKIKRQTERERNKHMYDKCTEELRDGCFNKFEFRFLYKKEN